MSKAPQSLLLLLRRPQLLLLLLLLFLCCAIVCAAWDDGGVHSAGVVREVPHKGQSGMQAYTVATSQRQLIRIVTSMEDLKDDTKFCSKEGVIINDPLKHNCEKRDVISADLVTKLMNTIIPAAVKLHADRLLVDRRSTPLTIPPFEQDSHCNLFTVPETHRKEGVADADMVLYVATKPAPTFGVICANESSGRPIAGGLNFIPYPSVSNQPNVRQAAHHIGHALGFDYELMKKLGMISTITVRGAQRVIVSSEMTRKKAQEHYGCSDLEGVELDYLDSEKKVSSTWSWRNTKDELMNNAHVFAGSYYTALTMAAFHDMKFYSANWGMEEPMSWGYKAGCDFIRGKCLTDNVSNYPNAFCTEDKLQCSTDRFGIAMCVPPKELYFGTTNTTYDCSVLLSRFSLNVNGNLTSWQCTDIGKEGLPGFLTEGKSMCLTTDDYQMEDGHDSLKLNAVCALVSCDESKRKVQVKYSGSDEYHDCPEGGSLTVSSSASLNFTTIQCPKYTEVCTIAPNGSSLIPFVTPTDREPSPSPELPSTPTLPSAETAVPGVDSAAPVAAVGDSPSAPAQQQESEAQEQLGDGDAAVGRTAPPTITAAPSHNQSILLGVNKDIARRVGADDSSAVHSILHTLLLAVALAVVVTF